MRSQRRSKANSPHCSCWRALENSTFDFDEVHRVRCCMWRRDGDLRVNYILVRVDLRHIYLTLSSLPRLGPVSGPSQENRRWERVQVPGAVGATPKRPATPGSDAS
ncbi:unnamed protein product [Schistocephalus solidus]|uniref:Uncharacterized protein n=1 Tax=Schistocephalus solidus TaxID=70667 RepID=A0A183SH05_SCHSO|nr:unnamed protein product [Schistocephalus solidus]